MKLVKQVIIRQYLTDNDHFVFVIESDGKSKPLMTRSLKELGKSILSLLDIKTF